MRVNNELIRLQAQTIETANHSNSTGRLQRECLRIEKTS